MAPDEGLTEISENESSLLAGYPRRRFVALLVILGLLIVTIGFAQHRRVSPGEESSISEATLEGDISIKISYAYERWGSLGSGKDSQAKWMRSFRDTQRRSAVTWYMRAVRQNPSPDNIRRLILIQNPDSRANEIAHLMKVASRGDLSEAERGKLRAEAGMWRAIYLSRNKLSGSQVKSYAALIRGLELGWYERLALTDLYERAGMAAQARYERDGALKSASLTVGWLIGLLVVLGILGLAGLAFIVCYIVISKHAARNDSYAVPGIPAETRERASGYFLEIFVAYMMLLIGVQVVAAAALMVLMRTLQSASSFNAIILAAGAYVTGGILALFYLLWRLRRASWPMEAIGFITRKPLADVAWGIGGYAAALPLVVLGSLVSRFFGRYLPTPPNPVIPLVAESNTVIEKLVLFVLVAVAAPFFEELFFRGVLFTSFRAKWGVSAGIVLSSLVFASVHPLPLGLLPIFALATVFAILVQRRKSLLPAMVAHGLNNTVAFAVLLILTGR